MHVLYGIKLAKAVAGRGIVLLKPSFLRRHDRWSVKLGPGWPGYHVLDNQPCNLDLLPSRKWPNYLPRHTCTARIITPDFNLAILILLLNLLLTSSPSHPRPPILSYPILLLIYPIRVLFQTALKTLHVQNLSRLISWQAEKSRIWQDSISFLCLDIRLETEKQYLGLIESERNVSEACHEEKSDITTPVY